MSREGEEQVLLAEQVTRQAGQSNYLIIKELNVMNFYEKYAMTNKNKIYFLNDDDNNIIIITTKTKHFKSRAMHIFENVSYKCIR